jgi:hypothetical protein
MFSRLRSGRRLRSSSNSVQKRSRVAITDEPLLPDRAGGGTDWREGLRSLFHFYGTLFAGLWSFECLSQWPVALTSPTHESRPSRLNPLMACFVFWGEVLNLPSLKRTAARGSASSHGRQRLFRIHGHQREFFETNTRAYPCSWA